MVAHVGPFVTRCSHREPSPLWLDRYYPPRRSTIRKSGGCLVVDDHVDSADIIAITLDARGHTTCVAYTAEQALELALSFEPDVALLDLSLGGHSGYDPAEAFRSRASLRGCRFVAVTGHAEEIARRRSEAAGFHRHQARGLDALFEAVPGDDERPFVCTCNGLVEVASELVRMPGHSPAHHRGARVDWLPLQGPLLQLFDHPVCPDRRQRSV